MAHFDVGIIGLGAMGSASLHALAQRGARAIGFDRYSPPHASGSTHGHTRIIREAYYEHPLYVPLVRRAYERWADLEREAGTTLFVQTGGVMVGPEAGQLVQGALASVQAHRISHEILDARTLSDRFPAYRARPDWVAVFERRAGMLFPERCVEAFLAGARRHGAELRLNEAVRRWSHNTRGIELETMTGKYSVDRLVVAAGPWLPSLIDSLGVSLPLEIERQLSHWFQPAAKDDRFLPTRCPIGLWE